MDPESKLLRAIDVGERTLAMAQCMVHHVAQVLAPDCAPLFLTDGWRESMTALQTHVLAAHAVAMPALGGLVLGPPRLLQQEGQGGVLPPPGCECLAAGPGPW